MAAGRSAVSSTANVMSASTGATISGAGASVNRPAMYSSSTRSHLIRISYACPSTTREELFEEKTNLFAELMKGEPVTWHGKTRPALREQDVVPHTGGFPVWIGVGGSPQSVVRAAHYGFSLMLAIIGRHPKRFAPYSQLFQQALKQFGRDPLPVGVHSPGHVAATDEQAQREFWPHYRDVITRVGKTRGFATPTEASYAHEVGPHGALYVGSPETVAQKIATSLQVLQATRFDLKYGIGGLPHESLMTTIELYGTEVTPRVRELLATSAAA